MGSQFTARFWKASSSLTSGYHPQNRQYGPTNNWDAFVMLHLHLIVSLAMLYTFSAQYTKQHRCQHFLDHSFQPQDRVWLSTRHLKLHSESKKLTPRFIGLYKITATINLVTNRLSDQTLFSTRRTLSNALPNHFHCRVGVISTLQHQAANISSKPEGKKILRKLLKHVVAFNTSCLPSTMPF